MRARGFDSCAAYNRSIAQPLGLVVAASIRILYLARFREAFGQSTETLDLAADVTTVGDLLHTLRLRGGAFAEELAPSRAWRVAVNQEMAEPDTLLHEGDEVAFFPPVTGG